MKLNIRTYFDPEEAIIRESNQSNTTQTQINHFYTRLTWCKIIKL